MSSNIGLIGNGGQANEIESYLPEGISVQFRAVTTGFVESEKPNLIDISQANEYVSTEVIGAVGAPQLRKEMIDLWPGKNFATVISEKATVDEGLILGRGSIIAPGVVITTNVKIGEHSLVNIGATISHDCKIGNFVTISPGVHVAGKVQIGDGVFIGIGATISNNVKIASGSVIGANSLVLTDVSEENSVVVGSPGKVIKRNDRWLSEI